MGHGGDDTVRRDGEAGGLVGLTRRKRRAARVWRWVRFRGAGGPALTAGLITAGAASRQPDEIWLGLMLGLGWLVGLAVDKDEKGRRARRMRAGADPNAPAVQYQRPPRIPGATPRSRLPRVEDPSRQPSFNKRY